MGALVPAFLAFLVGTLFSGYELLNSTYPMTCYFLLRNSRSIYVYSLIYGIFSFIFMLGIDYFGIFKCVITPIISNMWFQAIFVGVSTKAFLHIKFFDADPVPIGFETITYLFEPRLENQIDLDEFNTVRNYINNRMQGSEGARGYNDIAEVLRIIERNLPTRDRKLSIAFLKDAQEEISKYVGDDTKIMVAMEMYLREYGISSFDRSFPCKR